MSIMPELEIGLWNGWILSAIFLIAICSIMFTAPKENVKEMMDQEKQAKGRDKLVNALSIIIFLGIMFYAIFVPLKLGTLWFYVGSAMFVVGMIGEIITEVQLFFRTLTPASIRSLLSQISKPFFAANQSK